MSRVDIERERHLLLHSVMYQPCHELLENCRNDEWVRTALEKAPDINVLLHMSLHPQTPANTARLYELLSGLIHKWNEE